MSIVMHCIEYQNLVTICHHLDHQMEEYRITDESSKLTKRFLKSLINRISYFECSIHWRRCSPNTLRFRWNNWLWYWFNCWLFYLFLIDFFHCFIKISNWIFKWIKMFINSLFIWFLYKISKSIIFQKNLFTITCCSSLFVLIDSSIVYNTITIIKNNKTNNKWLYHRRRLIYNKMIRIPKLFEEYKQTIIIMFFTNE